MTSPGSSSEPDRKYGTAQVCAAAGLSRGIFDAWLLRKCFPLPPGPGTGRARTYTLLDAVRIAVVAELVRSGLTISRAADVFSLITEDGLPSGVPMKFAVCESSYVSILVDLQALADGVLKSLSDLTEEERGGPEMTPGTASSRE